ncbi:DHA2 family efflux MFS transporter permease subunit [Marinivivus vitaminiproducens]|uniref:DHA2 family efflux MFS transporter permease subunit n=1 Tax=Marinivivus vitaminiproducens TaxID=3035935 RepID=UPI0027A61CBC|nr:DHA2 family efflux MFS transporter permease subunit [Geminicoccaceae bacterium SCSIO 64248]
MPRTRVIPLIIAVALFMEQLDSTVIATSLPAIADDLGESPIALKLALTVYLLTLAVFIPISGWTADRFGAKRIFRAAILVFTAGSIACACAQSLEHFVFARALQGLGGAMMTPVGRLVLLRSVEKHELVGALAWLTVPALLGPVLGPPVGGFITTFASWHWIFLINVPIGLIGWVLVTRFIPNHRVESPPPLDVLGFLYAGLGVGALAFGLSVAGLDLLPRSAVAGLIVGGGALCLLYLHHARRVANPILDFDLLRLPTYYASVVGGFLFRIGIGSLPFLLPLMFQLGFGMTPFESGMLTFASALGALIMKASAAPILRRFGFRRVLAVNAVLSAGFLATCSLFTPATPHALILALLLIGGFFRSLQFTSINAIAYADIPPAQISRATSLSAVGQQLSLSAGVALGAFALETAFHARGGAAIAAQDFGPAFLVVAAVAAASTLVFARLATDAGAVLATRPELAAKPVKDSPA